MTIANNDDNNNNNINNNNNNGLYWHFHIYMVFPPETFSYFFYFIKMQFFNINLVFKVSW